MLYLPEEKETQCDLDGGQPHGVKVHHKVHELLCVG